MYTKSDVFFSVTKVSTQLTTLNLLQSKSTAYTDYKDVIMDLTEGIISDVAKSSIRNNISSYGEHEEIIKSSMEENSYGRCD